MNRAMKQTPLDSKTKKTLKILFLTLFLDLVGFSIIFPLFPELIQYYLTVDNQNFFLTHILKLVSTLSGNHVGATTVIFGGILASVFSLLQFLFSPFWGKLSDKIGRKPILVISLTGLAASYVLWFFAHSFTILILGRILGGMMAGNISTVTAVVGDITEQKDRSRGMAVIGMAFGLGFILGPAIGGLCSLVKLDQHWTWFTNITPFSFAALVALILTLINLVSVIVQFDETLPKEKRGKAENTRTANIFALLRPLPFPGVNLANFANFFFLIAFSGMEFTLTFLAHDRFQYDAHKNAMLFVFTGFLIALVQGGFVRRKAHQMGEKKMAGLGVVILIPGMLIIGNASSVALLYLGLSFMAIGSAMIIPCLTALASLFTPAESQGHSMGIFRSLGALARILGPLIACLTYWRFGSLYPYVFGAVFLLLPLFLIFKLPKPKMAHS